VITDDDFSGTLLDCPGLDEIRAMAKRREMDVVALRDQRGYVLSDDMKSAGLFRQPTQPASGGFPLAISISRLRRGQS
jgi:hypothetical protein